MPACYRRWHGSGASGRLLLFACYCYECVTQRSRCTWACGASLNGCGRWERGTEQAKMRSQMKDVTHGCGGLVIAVIAHGRWRRQWCWWWWRLRAVIMTSMEPPCDILTIPVSVIAGVRVIVCVSISMCVSISYKTFVFICACVCVSMSSISNLPHHHHRPHCWCRHHKRYSHCHLNHLGQTTDVAVHLQIVADLLLRIRPGLTPHWNLPHGHRLLTVLYEDGTYNHCQCWEIEHIASDGARSATPNHFNSLGSTKCLLGSEFCECYWKHVLIGFTRIGHSSIQCIWTVYDFCHIRLLSVIFAT